MLLQLKQSTLFPLKTRQMKSTETEFTNVASPNISSMSNEQSIRRIAREGARTSHQDGTAIMLRRWHFTAVLAAGSLAFAPLTLAHGNSGGHMSGMGNQGSGQHHEHWGYDNPFWGSSYGYAGSYDTAYSYTPTREQQATARQQVEAYLLAVKKGRKHPATHRYISVETLRPTKKQLEDFSRRQPPTRHVEPEQMRCLMVFDTQTREFVGSRCYVVSTAPPAGDVAQFETVSAEFVGHEKL
jgi:hypothetical protein